MQMVSDQLVISHPLGNEQSANKVSQNGKHEPQYQLRMSHYPDTPAYRQYRAEYNTRVVARSLPSIDSVVSK